MKKLLVLVLVFVAFFSVNYAQTVQPLTDRELLVQLMERVTSIVTTVNKIESKTDFITEKVNTLENKVINIQGQIDGLVRRDVINTDKVSTVEDKVIKNEQDIAVFCDKVDTLVERWNILLGLFATLLLGMFVYMWKEISKRKQGA